LEEIPRRKINAKQVTIIQNFETFEKPKEKWQKRQTMVEVTQNRQLKIEQHELCWKN
jgi:hypothetical protein